MHRGMTARWTCAPARWGLKCVSTSWVNGERCHKWAILERKPLPSWSEGRVVLLGDASHPMTPYMAQGAATAIEDAAILARCLEAAREYDIEAALARYEAHRKPRTSRIQAISSANTWMQQGEQDTSWLYGYDPWNVQI